MRNIIVLILFIGAVGAFSARRFNRGRGSDSDESDERRVYRPRQHYYFSKHTYARPPVKQVVKARPDSSEENEDSSEEPAVSPDFGGSQGNGGGQAPIRQGVKQETTNTNTGGEQAPIRHVVKQETTNNKKEVPKVKENEVTEEEEDEDEGEEEEGEEGEETEEVEENGENQNATDTNGEIENEEESLNGTETGTNSTNEIEGVEAHANSTSDETDQGLIGAAQTTPASEGNNETIGEQYTTPTSDANNGNIGVEEATTPSEVNIVLQPEATTAGGSEGPENMATEAPVTAENVNVDVINTTPSQTETEGNTVHGNQGEHETDSSTPDYEHGNEYDHVITRGDNYAPYHPYEDEYNYKGYHGYDEYAVQEYYNEA
ncbi:integrin-binding sialoprotein-like [Pleurodeles waltl]